MRQWPETHLSYRLPIGALTVEPKASIRVHLRTSHRGRSATRSALEALSELDPSRFLTPNEIEELGDSFVLGYTGITEALVPLSTLVSDWRRHPAVYIAQAITLARVVAEAAVRLEQIKLDWFPMSPAQLFKLDGNSPQERWVVAPLPLGGATVGDWVGADQIIWEWLSSDQALGVRRSSNRYDRVYQIGAALHYCLVGSLYPARLSKAEKFQKLLNYSAGQPWAVRTSMERALPKAHQEVGTQLAGLMLTALQPPTGRSLTSTGSRTQLERMQRLLSAEALCLAWLDDGQDGPALDIVNEFKRSKPTTDLSFSVLQRVNAGAVGLVSQIRALAGAQDLEQLRDLLKTLRNQTVHLSGDERLCAAYAEGRFFGNAEYALKQLAAVDAPIARTRFLRFAVMARLYYDIGDFAKMHRSCDGTKLALKELPNNGGEEGEYITAYVEILDGIAHCKAVADQSVKPGYLMDALECFQRGWAIAHKIGANELRHAVEQWISQLMELLARQKGAEELVKGAKAFAQVIGLSAQPSSFVGPERPVPWPTETIVCR